MAKEIFSRVEVKYKLNTAQKDAIIAAISEYMKPDKYNIGGKVYTISNIYYDTNDNELIHMSLSKPKYKEKLRMRGYGVPKPGDVVYFEIKKKYKGVVNKRRTSLELEEAKKFAETGIMPELKPYMNKQVLKELEYFLHIYDLAPALYLAYDRLAFFDNNDPDFRVSFDTNIRTRRYDLSLDAGDYGQQLMDSDVWLMETKIDKNLPLWFTRILTENKAYSTSFSKYGTEYAKLVEKNRMGESEFITSSFL